METEENNNMEEVENKEEVQVQEQLPPKKSNKIVGYVILAIVVFGLGYFIASFENPYQTKDSCFEEINQTSIYYANYGYTTAVMDILNEVQECKPVPINYQNETYSIFLVECLNLDQENNG
jgi:hypothetical protein